MYDETASRGASKWTVDRASTWLCRGLSDSLEYETLKVVGKSSEHRDPRVAVLIADRLVLIGIAEGAEFFDDILTFDARVQADLSVRIGTNGIGGSASGSVCNASGCLELVGASVEFFPNPELCFSAGPASGCVRL